MPHPFWVVDSHWRQVRQVNEVCTLVVGTKIWLQSGKSLTEMACRRYWGVDIFCQTYAAKNSSIAGSSSPLFSVVQTGIKTSHQTFWNPALQNPICIHPLYPRGDRDSSKGRCNQAQAFILESVQTTIRTWWPNPSIYHASRDIPSEDRSHEYCNMFSGALECVIITR
jgi:hypothetical protein